MIIIINNRDSCATCTISFKNQLGDTYKEKFHEVCLKLAELTDHLIAEGANEDFWIICPSGLIYLFDLSACGQGRQIASPWPDIVWFKKYGRWQIFERKDTEFPEQLILGYGYNNDEKYQHLYVINLLQVYVY